MEELKDLIIENIIPLSPEGYRLQFRNLDNERIDIKSRKNEDFDRFVDRCHERVLKERKMDPETLARHWTFDDLFTFWIEHHVKRHLRAGADKHLQGLYQVHLKKTLGDRKLNDVPRHELFSLMESLEEKQLAPYTINTIRGLISRPYHWAQSALGLQCKCPTDGFVYRKRRVQKPSEIRVMDPAEIRLFWEASKNTPYFVAYKVMLYTGLRPSEALALQAGDIYDNKVHVRRGIVREGISPLKTPAAHREVPIPDALRDDLMDHIARVERLTDEGWLFPAKARVGYNPPSMYAFRSSFRRARKRTGVYETDANGKKVTVEKPLDIKMNTFRKTYATRLAEAGIPEEALRRYMGHESITTTRKFYIGLSKKQHAVGEDLAESLSFE